MSETLAARVEKGIRDVPDFPKEGILFKDITTVLNDGALFREITDYFVARYADQKIDRVVGIESRGFIFGTPIANALGVGFVPVRKPGKLPYETIGHSYELEYGSDRVEMHIDAIQPGERVLLVDDLLATGGTAEATLVLLEKSGANVIECAFLISLEFLNGREKLAAPCHALVEYS